MKKLFKYSLGVLAIALAGSLSSCSEYEPRGYEELPDLPTASDIKATVDYHTINVTWGLPANTKYKITDVQMIVDADNGNPISLGPDATSYSMHGHEWDVDALFTVKIVYEDLYVSTGVTASAMIPYEKLPAVSGLKSEVKGRRVILDWTNPQGGDITGIRIVTNNNIGSAIYLPKETEHYVMTAQPMDEDLEYAVEVMYDSFYPSPAETAKAFIPYFEAKAGFYMTAATPADLPDDDERAAAEWFSRQENCEFISRAELATLDPDKVSVLWICIDRVGLPLGWQNLPAEFIAPDVIQALKDYSINGGALYFSTMATQLTVPLGFVPDNMAPTVYGNGDGGSGDDVWVLNPHLGWDFKDGGDQDYYDRAEHAIYAGITLEDPNKYGYSTIPLIGPGQREDHNCMWDCNIYGKGSYNNVIKNFEMQTGSLVLATWGHVRDHCVAGIVEFYSTPNHGRCIANGLAAYEWNQNSGPNIYQENIEKLTANIINYLR